MLPSPPTLIKNDLSAAIIRDPIVVAPSISVLDAIIQMSKLRASCSMANRNLQEDRILEARSSCVFVIENDQLLGIFTERDVVRLSARQYSLDQIMIREVMTQSLITIQESQLTHLHVVLKIFKDHHIRHLPVVNDKKLIGLLTHETLQQSSRPVDLLRVRTVEDVMTRQVVCASRTTTILAIAQLMAEQHVSCVVITDEQFNLTQQSIRIPVGILTERDIVQFKVLGLDLNRCPAQDCMSTPVFSISAEDSLLTAKQWMAEYPISRLVVVGSQGELKGIVTPSSLLQMLTSLELHHLNSLLEQKVLKLEQEKVFLLENRTVELERQVQERTLALNAKSERERLVSTLAAQILSSLSLQEILDTTTEEVRQLLKCDRVNIWQFQPDWSTLAVAESTEMSTISLVGQTVQDSCFRESYLAKYRQGQARVIEDIHTATMSDCHRELLINLQTRAKILVPIVSGDQLWGLLHTTESHSPRCWKTEEINLLQELAVHLGIAIQQATTYEQVQHELHEHKTTEVRLRESERRYASLAAAAPVGIFRTDRDCNYLYVNERWCLISGLSQAQALGQGWKDRLHPDDQDLVEVEWNKAIEEQVPFQLEYRLLRADGRIAWVYGQTVAEQDYHGEITGYIGTITDISDRKQAEITLNNLVEGTAAVTGQDFFPAIVRHIAEALDVRYALVTQLVEGELKALAFWANGELQPPFSYSPLQTPCERAIQEGQYYCDSFVQLKFPNDPDLSKMGADSYLGISLKGRMGNPIGNLCILDTKKIRQAKRAEKILQVFAGRAAAEIERKVALDALKRLNQSLETSVEQRTEELEDRKAELQDFFENANDLIQSISIQDGAFEFVNRAWRETLGYSDSEVQSLTVNDVLHPKSRQYFQDILSHIQSDDASACNRIEVTFLDKQQNEVLVEGSIDFRIEDNRRVAQRAIFRDITERKSHENALRESQKLLQTVLDAFPLYVYWKNRDSVYIGCNQNFAKAAGFQSPQEIAGKTDYDLPWADTEAENYRTDDRQIITSKTGKLGIIETQLQADGQKNWIETNKIPLHDLEGDVIGVLGTYQDISVRKQAEEAIKQHSAAIEAAVDGIAILQNDHYLYLNQAHITLLGYDTLDEIKGQHWLSLYREEESHRFETVVFPKLRRDRHWRGETVAIRKDKTLFAQELSLTLTDDDLLICVCRDISDRKEYESQLHQKNVELARATRMKDEFLANMSHELRTPLNTILGMSEVLQEEIFGALNRQQQNAIATMERSGTHLLELINDILDLSKIEAGKVILDYQSTVVQTLCKSSLSFVTQQALKKQIQLQTHIPSHLPKLLADERRLRQVLINLLNNAVKFTPEGGQVSLHVEMTLSSAQNHPELWVMSFTITDTGIGIAKEDIDRLFQPFMQIDSALNRKFSGTGLGLSLVKQIVELHGGWVYAHSDVGVGSQFTIELPCIDYQTSPPVQLSPAPSTLTPSAQNHTDKEVIKADEKTPLILLAEDNDANIMTISSYLKNKGYRLIFANNGQEAIDKTISEQPDLILMDIQMPEVDGLEAIHQIRRNQKIPKIPIIALTALAMSGDRERCLDAGANEYLAKPVKLKQLAITIEACL